MSDDLWGEPGYHYVKSPPMRPGGSMPPRAVGPTPGRPYDDADAALGEFYTRLPGWWITMGRCGLTCHASCGPDSKFISEPILSRFDAGFNADIPNPTTLGTAIRNVMDQALASLGQDAKP